MTVGRRTIIRSSFAAVPILLITFFIATAPSSSSSSLSSGEKRGWLAREHTSYGLGGDGNGGRVEEEGWGRGMWWEDPGTKMRDWIGMGGKGSGPQYSPGSVGVREEDQWVDFDEEMEMTRYEGGIAGYQVFSNLYLTGGALMAITPNPTLRVQEDADMDGEVGGDMEGAIPETKYIISSNERGEEAGPDRWRVDGPEVGRQEIGKRGYRLGGVTFIFNDKPGPAGYLIYFKHFATEAFLGAARVLASVLPAGTPAPLPKRIWFPRCPTEPSWKDDRNENVWFLTHAVPSATIEDANGWEVRALGGVTLQLERVVIIDRWAAHTVRGDAGKWGKMNVLIPSVQAPQTFWDPYLNNVVQSVGADEPSNTGSRGLPVVVYIDRQKEGFKMRDEDHQALVQGLMSLTPLAEVHVAKMGAMTKARQVDLISRAKIVIGLHGDELISGLWMPSRPGSTLIEIFEEGGFEREHELMATALNHQYIAIQHDHVVAREKWMEAGASQGEERKSGVIKVNADVVVRTIEEILGENQYEDEEVPEDGDE
ncbi:hypothetical protein IAT38_001933 [Cryptococcus sp. DSM 104549]